MSELYTAVFDEFKKELEKSATEIFLHPLPFTQVNRLAMLAATVAERCIAEQDAALDAACSRDHKALIDAGKDFCAECYRPLAAPR